MKKSIVFTVIFLHSIAAHAFFCPSNFNQIDLGDPVAKVLLLCGKPASDKKSESSIMQPQEWVYFVRVNPTDQSTLRTTVAFDHGVVTNMTVNGIGLSQTSICNNISIQTSSSMDDVKAACGKPVFINQGDAKNLPPPIEVLELKYDSDPPATLVFENGKLTGRK